MRLFVPAGMQVHSTLVLPTFDIIGTYNSTVTDNVTASSQYEFINVEKVK